MRFYLIDDDKNILNILKIILTERLQEEICGTSTSPVDALEDIAYAKPDIILVDLLMPGMDGISFVQKARKLDDSILFIMLSQVASKDIIAAAYENGVEFFIQKPLNSIEIESVIQKVSHKLSMQRMLTKMQTLFQSEMSSPLTLTPAPAAENDLRLSGAKSALQKLGIIGELGSKDILLVLSYLLDHPGYADDFTLKELCKQISDTPKSSEQRIRRAAYTGLVNLAHLGLEDYGNEIFAEYSNTLYNFEQIRKEMDYIRGKSTQHGNVRVRGFLNVLISYSEK